MRKIYIILIDTFVWLKGQQLLKNVEKSYNFIIKSKTGEWSNISLLSHSKQKNLFNSLNNIRRKMG